jgi:hypothetical protein
LLADEYFFPDIADRLLAEPAVAPEAPIDPAVRAGDPGVNLQRSWTLPLSRLIR